MYLIVQQAHVEGGGLSETMTEEYEDPRGGLPWGAHRPVEEFQGGLEDSLGVRLLVILRIQGMEMGAGGMGDLRSTLGCTGLRFFEGRVDGCCCCWRCFFGGVHRGSSGLVLPWRLLAGTHLNLWPPLVPSPSWPGASPP